MHLKKNIEFVVNQLSSVLLDLSDEEYTTPSTLLNNNSIGAHYRHVIELFQCLLKGYEIGTVNYTSRIRDKRIETERLLAVELLFKIEKEISKPNKTLTIHEMVSLMEPNVLLIETNFDREVLYNLEHTIHHMALIRIAIKEKSNIVLPDDFGVAFSTTQYKMKCAQ